MHLERPRCLSPSVCAALSCLLRGAAALYVPAARARPSGQPSRCTAPPPAAPRAPRALLACSAKQGLVVARVSIPSYQQPGHEHPNTLVTPTATLRGSRLGGPHAAAKGSREGPISALLGRKSGGPRARLRARFLCACGCCLLLRAVACCCLLLVVVGDVPGDDMGENVSSICNAVVPGKETLGVFSGSRSSCCKTFALARESLSPSVRHRTHFLPTQHQQIQTQADMWRSRAHKLHVYCS